MKLNKRVVPKKRQISTRECILEDLTSHFDFDRRVLQKLHGAPEFRQHVARRRMKAA